eukprot:scaffold4516_cov417-Prasinococcus_capsulatus_cf.AAC.13
MDGRHRRRQRPPRRRRVRQHLERRSLNGAPPHWPEGSSPIQRGDAARGARRARVRFQSTRSRRRGLRHHISGLWRSMSAWLNPLWLASVAGSGS